MKYLILAGSLFVMAACQNSAKKPATAEEVLEKASKAPGINAGADKFSIATPAGWVRLDTTMSNAKITFLFAETLPNGFRPNINVVTESMRDQKLDDYFKKNMKVMAEYMQNFVPGAVTEKEINGHKARTLAYSHSQNGLDMDVVLTLIPIDGIAYAVTLTAPKGQLAGYTAQYEEVLKSLQVS